MDYKMYNWNFGINRIEIGKKLRQLRVSNNYTLEKLGCLLASSNNGLGVDPNRISKWERGINEVPIEILITLTNIYRVNLNEIIHPDWPQSEITNNPKIIYFDEIYENGLLWTIKIDKTKFFENYETLKNKCLYENFLIQKAIRASLTYEEYINLLDYSIDNDWYSMIEGKYAKVLFMKNEEDISSMYEQKIYHEYYKNNNFIQFVPISNNEHDNSHYEFKVIELLIILLHIDDLEIFYSFFNLLDIFKKHILLNLFYSFLLEDNNSYKNYKLRDKFNLIKNDGKLNRLLFYDKADGISKYLKTIYNYSYEEICDNFIEIKPDEYIRKVGIVSD